MNIFGGYTYYFKIQFDTLTYQSRNYLLVYFAQIRDKHDYMKLIIY